jgi:hypothetical protein
MERERGKDEGRERKREGEGNLNDLNLSGLNLLELNCFVLKN